MTSDERSRRTPTRTILVAFVAVAITILVAVAVVVGGWPPSPEPPHAVESSSLRSPAPPSPSPTAQVRCAEEAGPLAAGLRPEACPSAILAVELAVAPVRLPIDRVVIEPGPIYCDLLWPGVQTSRPCVGYAVRPGQFMHAWVSFTRSTKVAVVMLGLNLPPDDAPVATRPPWSATLVAVEIPPDGWVMP